MVPFISFPHLFTITDGITSEIEFYVNLPPVLNLGILLLFRVACSKPKLLSFENNAYKMNDNRIAVDRSVYWLAIDVRRID